jgi:two-component system sensor histidine kinase ChvG
LYAQRRQLVKLTLFVLLAGLGLAWWMGSRMVRPVENLREEVLERARTAIPKAELSVEREDEVGDLALAFNALLGALAERSRANEAFVADLAHEFKNPVAAIRACAERLEGEGTLDEARAKRLAQVLSQSSRRLDALVSQFLELARAEAGLPNETREPVDTSALVRGIVDTARLDPRFAGVRFDVHTLDDGPEVNGVPYRLESALRNLVDNASSFAGDGGTVTVHVTCPNGTAEIVVEDTGPGILAEDVPRVFDRFFTRRETKSGTGLGLALTRAVVEAHGGTIHAQSPAGKGARFVVRLPLSTLAMS